MEIGLRSNAIFVLSLASFISALFSDLLKLTTFTFTASILFHSV